MAAVKAGKLHGITADHPLEVTVVPRWGHKSSGQQITALLKQSYRPEGVLFLRNGYGPTAGNIPRRPCISRQPHAVPRDGMKRHYSQPVAIVLCPGSLQAAVCIYFRRKIRIKKRHLDKDGISPENDAVHPHAFRGIEYINDLLPGTVCYGKIKNHLMSVGSFQRRPPN